MLMYFYSQDTFFDNKLLYVKNENSLKKQTLFHLYKSKNKIKRVNLARDSRSHKTEVDDHQINVARRRMDKNKNNNNMYDKNTNNNSVEDNGIDIESNNHNNSHLPFSTKLFKSNHLKLSPELIAISSGQ